jgi:hypothetical protein
MLNDAAVHGVTGVKTIFSVDEKTLAANGTMNVRGKLRWLAYVHRTLFPNAFAVLLLCPATNWGPVCGRSGRAGMAKDGSAGATDGVCRLVP